MVSDQPVINAKYTKRDVVIIMDKVIEEISFLREAGQQEYAHQDDRPFRNFETLASELNMTREQILWVYARKHMDGILSYINGHRSQRESVAGRINDLIVYLIILRAMFEEDRIPVHAP